MAACALERLTATAPARLTATRRYEYVNRDERSTNYFSPLGMTHLS